MKTLYDYLMNTEGEEVTVYDKDYDMEVYFYRNDDPTDVWDKSMVEFSKLLEVVEETGNFSVIVNMSELIEKHLDKMGDLFKSVDIDDIMYDMDSILAGNVSEKWIENFVSKLK